MKILIVSYKFPPENMSGLEMGSDFMARHLALRGHDVHVIVTRRDAGQSFSTFQHGYKLWRLPVLPIPILRSIFEVCMTSLLLLFIRPQIVHGQAMVPCGLVSGFWSKILSIRSLVYLYGRDVTHPNDFLRMTLGKRVLKWNDTVLAATDHCRNNALKIHDCDIKVFYSGYEPSKIDLDVERKNNSLLFVGRLEDIKGLDIVLNAVSKIETDFSLTVVGSGSKKETWQRLAQSLNLCDKITWLGELNNEEVLKLMRQNQVLVLPSREEPFGIVLIEALSQGCRVVASNVGGIPEIVKDDSYGLLHEVDDQEGVTTCIKQSFDLGPLSNDIVENVKNYYSWSSRIKELENYY